MIRSSCLIALLTLLLGSLPCFVSAFEAEMEVAYETRRGFSDWHTVDVSFASGQELNRKIGTFSFDMIANYALIWFDRDEVAILKIDSPMSIGGREFEERNWRFIFAAYMDVRAVQVNGKRNVEWKLRKPLLRRRR